MPAVRVTSRSLLRSIRRLDHLRGRLGGRRAVLVEARTPLNLAVLRPVFEPLLDDDRLNVLFTGVTRADLARAIDELDLRSRFVARPRTAWMRIDLYVNSDPWEAVRLRRVAKQLNFFHGVAGKYDLDCPSALPLGFERYDRVAFPNESRRNSYVAAGVVSAERAALVGYPKVDALVQESGRSRERAACLGLDSSRPTVIFAPTFSPASALNHAGEAIIRTLLQGGCNVIAKLHDRSLDSDPRYSGGVDWRARLAQFHGQPFLLAESGDSTPYVLASDAMVTDHSSIGFEFCALDRPLIVFDAPHLIETARINPQKVTLLRSAAAVVGDVPSLLETLRDALANPAARSAERRRVAAQAFYRPGEATGRALRLVYELLDLPIAVERTAGRDFLIAGAGTRPALQQLEIETTRTRE